MIMTNQSYRKPDMTPDEIAEYCKGLGLSVSRFWSVAMGGDVASLPESVVVSICDEHEYELTD